MDTSLEEDPLLQLHRGPIPRDRFNLVYIIFYVLGLGSLTPWNFFITASEYFKYKLRNTTLPTGDFLNPSDETQLQAIFESYLTVASTVPNLVFNFITAALIQRIGLKTRMTSSLCTILVVFILTVILVKVNTDTWQYHFFWITMVTAAIISAGGSVLGTSLFGLVSLFPPCYMQATMTGQAMGGLFAAIANLVTLCVGSHVEGSGLGFFSFATFTTLSTLLGYGALYFIDYSKYHIIEIGDTINVNVHVDDSETISSVDIRTGCLGYRNIFKKIWKEGLSVALVYFVTLSCFPAIASAVISMDKSNMQWMEKYFSALVCFLLFNAGDWSGRCLAGSVQYPKPSHTIWLLVLTVLRVVFIPLLMFCNVQPRHGPVLFQSDLHPVVFILMLGLTNGYFGTLAMMYGPVRARSDQAESAGAIMATCLTIGLVTGSLFALLLVKIV